MLNTGEIVRARRGLVLLPRAEGKADIDKAQILVIDDEPSVADALRIILEDDGYQVAVATTGLEGIELARRRRFDVVVSDVRLPDINGLEVLRAVCESSPCSVVILITSHSTTKLLQEAHSCGAFDVLQKPFPPSDVLRLIAAAIDETR